MSTQDQVLQILQAAIAAGVPMQLAPSPVSLWFDQTGQKLYPPVDDLRDITYAEAIRHQLRYHPDAVIGFVYSASPPLVFVTRQAGGVVPLDFDEYRPEGEIRPRHDLVREVVVVNWERTRAVNGREMTEMWVDRWPLNATGRELGALVMTIESRGPTTKEMESWIETWAVDTGSLVWWTDRAPWLADPRVKNLKFAIEAGYQVPQRAWSALPQELLNGQIADWMQLNRQALRVEDDRATAWFDYDFEVVPGRPEKMRTRRVDYPFRATDGITGNYRSVTTAGGELVLLNLAKYLQTGVGKVYWEGSITITKPEVQDLINIGNKLWLRGLNPEWATMSAIVQQVVDDVDAGITTVSFGPPARLKAGDLLSLLK